MILTTLKALSSLTIKVAVCGESGERKTTSINLHPLTTEKIWAYVFETYPHKTLVAISHEPILLRHANRFIHFRAGSGRECTREDVLQTLEKPSA